MQNILARSARPARAPYALRLLSAAALAALSALPAGAQTTSKAANYLIEATIREGCSHLQGTGAMDMVKGVFLGDFDGDGREDLILSHEGVDCDAEGFGRSSYCGAQVCSGTVYLRRGDLLQPADHFLGIVTGIQGGPPPTISIMGHGGKRHSFRWNGQKFDTAR